MSNQIYNETPEHFPFLERAFDAASYVFANTIKKSSDYEDRISAIARSYQDQGYVNSEQEYIFNLVGTINGRASTIIGHLSIMIAVSFFILSQVNGFIYVLIISIESLSYVTLALFSLRCLTSMGKGAISQNPVEITDNLRREMAIRFSILDTSVVLTVAVTSMLFFSCTASIILGS